MTSQFQTQLNAMSTISAWLRYLEQLHIQPMELGLDRIRCVADRLDVTTPKPYVITVAGTNGKGTTCRMIESILMESGYRVGVYSSPHLIRFNERVRINDQSPDDMAFVHAFHHIEQHRGDITLTFFEFTTLAALWLFKHAELDVVILEVGLGGRLDATNIVDADMAVITSIDLDHTNVLGHTREGIGREKAGIFRAGCLAVVGEPVPPHTVQAYAESLGTLLKVRGIEGDWDYTVAEVDWRWTTASQTYTHLPLPKIPIANAATALAALHYSTFKIHLDALTRALSSSMLPGRFQCIQQAPRIILDVAHNPHAATYLNGQLNSIEAMLPKRGLRRIVIGMLKDKDIASTLQALSADVWYCGSLTCFRGADAEELAQFLPSENIQTFASIQEAWQRARVDAAKDDIIVVCGSFHTVADVMRNLTYE